MTRHALVVLLGAGLALGACSTPTEAPAVPTTAAIEEPPVDVAPPGQSLTPPGTIVFAHAADATKLDPSDVTDSESLLVTWHLYEGLTRYVRGTTEVEPALATEWTTSEDGLEWTFTLRQGVTFHDGTAFDADAVVWNFERWFDPDHPYHFSTWEFAYFADMFQGYKGGDSVLASVEAVDPGTVKLTLTRPSAPLLQNLAMGNFGFSSPSAVEQAGESYGTPDGSPIAAGTGPYMLQDWRHGEEIILVANPSYWGAQPATPTLIMRVIPENGVRFLALQAGEVDGMNQVNPEDIAAAESDANVLVMMEPANNVGYLGFNQAMAPWDNRSCRLAVAHAIDKAAIVDGLYAGDAQVANQMLPPSLWGFNPTVQDYAYDPAAAEAALAECLTTSTMPDTVRLHVPPIPRFYYPKPTELGEAVQAALAAVGINTTIEAPEWATYLEQVRGGQAELFLLGWGGDNGDPDNFLCVFFCGGDRAWNSAADGSPLPPNEELNSLLREAATLTDQGARRQMYEDASAMAVQEVLSVPLVHRSPPTLFRASVTGYVPSPIQTLLTTVTKP